MDVRRASSSRERVEACLPKSIHFLEAEGHTIGLPFSWLLLLGKQKKQLAHLLFSNYGVVKIFVCENLFRYNTLYLYKIPAFAGMTRVKGNDEGKKTSTNHLSSQINNPLTMRKLQLAPLITRRNTKHIAITFTEMRCRDKPACECDIDDRFAGLQ